MRNFIEGSPASPWINPDSSLPAIIIVELLDEIFLSRDEMQYPRSSHSIVPFPDFLSEIEEGIREPKLASVGPYYNGKGHLPRFEKHKIRFRSNFLERIGRSSYTNLTNELLRLERSIRDCYSENTASMSSEDFVEMVITDGSFIVELFRQFPEDLDTIWPRFNYLNTLTADLLKMGNQLPFFVLEELYRRSSNNQSTSEGLRTLALRFFNKALGRPLDMVLQNNQQPKHLLDLFRSSLLPVTPFRNNCEAFQESIQRAEMLCNAGITLRRKRANSLLEIDFRKLQLPPFTLKIPSVAIDDLTSTILMNCVALEQCLNDTSKHFTAYICFMYCLVTQPEDVRFLRTANIIRCIQRDDHVIKLLDSVRGKVLVFARDNYLWKQCRDIDSYYDSHLAYIWSNLARYNYLAFVVSIVAATISFCNWLFPKHNSPTHGGHI